MKFKMQQQWQVQTPLSRKRVGGGIGAFPFCDCIVGSFEEGPANQIVGAPFEVDDKDQNHVIIFKITISSNYSRSFAEMAIITVLFRKTNCTSREMAHSASSSICPLILSCISLMNREKTPYAYSVKYKLFLPFCTGPTNHDLLENAVQPAPLCSKSQETNRKISDLVFLGWQVKGN